MKKLMIVWWITLLAKLILSAVLPLASDETYFWVWSHHMRLSFFDHPPFVAWLLWMGQIFEDLGNAVRWPTVIMGHLTLLVWIRILGRYYSLEKARVWIWLALSSPLLGMGSMIAYPDVPVVFFWSCSTLLILDILETGRLRSYLLLGITLGLGFCSKYHIVILPMAALLFVAVEKKWRQLRWQGLALTVVAGLVASSPVLIWNYQNEFISFRFQLKHGLGRSWEPRWTFNYVLGEIMVVFPLVFWAALRSRVVPGLRLLYYTAWFPLAFLLLSSFRGDVQMNWPIIALPSIFALAALNEKWVPKYKYVHAFWFTILAILTVHVITPVLGKVSSRLEESHYYRPLEELPAQYSPLYASNYHMASYIWYQTKIPVYKLREMSRIDFYDYLDESLPKAEKFYVVSDGDESRFPAWVKTDQFSISRIKEINSVFTLYEVNRL